jgi:hypothetical protein
MTPREQDLARQLEECLEALKQSRRENELLRQKIDLLIRRVFGSSSERLDKTQLELLLQLSGETPLPPKETACATSRTSTGSKQTCGSIARAQNGGRPFVRGKAVPS